MTQENRRRFLASTGLAASAWALPKSLLASQAIPNQGGATFPAGFFWGASTAAAQVEGSPSADSGGESIWDVFLRTPHATKDGSTNLVADDEYHRWPEDIKLMQQLGFNAYRFSISWARVIPEGTGAVNSKGMDYYDRLIDALLTAKITPFVTAFHFDYPEALQRRSGWLNPDSPQWMADYAHLLSSRFSDRVSYWLTINEPNIYWAFGSEIGMMPPNQKLPDADLVRGSHNILLGHGESVRAIRAAAKRPVKVSLAYAGILTIPASENSADVAVARGASFGVRKIPIIPGLPPMAMLSTGWWLDPVYLGKYPEDGLKLFPDAEKIATSEHMKTINQPLDFCGINLYFAPQMKAGANSAPEIVPEAADVPRSHYGWAMTPEVLYWGPKFLYERYHQPIVVTENGWSSDDKPTPDGKVHDPQRTVFLNAYLKSFLRASQDGVPVNGYLHWSLLDNFQWGDGFGQRFGLIYVDFKTQKRIVKDSAMRYKQIVASNGAGL
ncbi:MAG TPA: family 1 glycosylhydrolase [Terriglobales bacterium]|nr:family 1 glycosylhydrolase [Terriglobales bacterium]